MTETDTTEEHSMRMRGSRMHGSRMRDFEWTNCLTVEDAVESLNNLVRVNDLNSRKSDHLYWVGEVEPKVVHGRVLIRVNWYPCRSGISVDMPSPWVELQFLPYFLNGWKRGSISLHQTSERIREWKESKSLDEQLDIAYKTLFRVVFSIETNTLKVLRIVPRRQEPGIDHAAIMNACIRVFNDREIPKPFTVFSFLSLEHWPPDWTQKLLVSLRCLPKLEHLYLTPDSRIHSIFHKKRTHRIQYKNGTPFLFTAPTIAIGPLLETMPHLKVLKTLYLSGNHWSSSIGQFIHGLQGKKTLTNLLLRDTCLAPEAVKSVASILQDNDCAIQHLDLSLNEEGFRDLTIFKALCASFPVNKTLTDLWLDHCGLALPHFEMLAAVLPTIHILQKLSLRGNSGKEQEMPLFDSDEDFQTYIQNGPGVLVNALEHNQSLLKLDLGSNSKGVWPGCSPPQYQFYQLDEAAITRLAAYHKRNNEAFDGCTLDDARTDDHISTMLRTMHHRAKIPSMDGSIKVIAFPDFEERRKRGIVSFFKSQRSWATAKKLAPQSTPTVSPLDPNTKVYFYVKMHGKQGRLEVAPDRIRFSHNVPGQNKPKSISVPWAKVEKHVITPRFFASQKLKIVAGNNKGKYITKVFVFRYRKTLVAIKKEIQEKLDQEKEKQKEEEEKRKEGEKAE